MFKPFKAMIGSDNLANAIWTVPSIIGLNFYMLQRVGPLIMTKFFFLSLFSTFIFWSAFNPQSGLNVRPLKNLLFKFDANAEDGTYYETTELDFIDDKVVMVAFMNNNGAEGPENAQQYQAPGK